MGDVYGIFLAQQRVADNVRRAFPHPSTWAEADISLAVSAPRRGELRRRLSLSLRRLADRVEPARSYDGCVPGVGAA